MRTVSIVVPAYNEERFIGSLLEQVIAVPTESVGFIKEIIVVDDGSQDRTAEVVSRFPVRLVQQPNQGKGSAVQRGVSEAKGEFVLVQDADLEYNPKDYLSMLRAIGDLDLISVYGSRTLGQARKVLSPPLWQRLGRHPQQSFGPWLAGVLLTLWTFLLYRTWIADTLTAYKIYPTAVLRSLHIVTTGFETDHEITAKLIKRGIRIVEVPIDYLPRSREEGKKIKAIDGFIAAWTLLRFSLG